jgi:hypothetical protein
MAKGVDKVGLEALLGRIEAEDGDCPLVAWLTTGAGDIGALDPADALLVVEAAHRMGLVERLQSAKTAGSKPVRKAAGRALHGLRSKGVDVPEPERSHATWTLEREDGELPQPVGLLGLPQSDGYFPFILVASGRQGACVCAGVAGAGQGYQDADHAHVGRGKARDIIADARRDHALIEVSFHTALHLAERAFAEGGRGHPHGWGHMLESVPEATQSSARLLDPLQRQTEGLDRAAMAEVDPLIEGPSRIMFGLDEEASGPAVEECVQALSSPVMTRDADRRARIAGIVKAATTQALAGAARRTWILAMDVTAVLAATKEDEPLRKAARQTSLALSAGLDGGEIPFFQIWVERQLAAVTEMVMSIRSEGAQR